MSSSGVISGTISSGTTGVHQVTVTATNGTNTDSATFFWQVGQLAVTNPARRFP